MNRTQKHPSVAFAVALSLLAAVASPRAASAQSAPFSSEAGAGLVAAAVGGLVYVPVSSWLISEAYDKAQSHGFGLYQPGAIFELVWGVLHYVGLAVDIGLDARPDIATHAFDIGVGVALAVVGSWFIGHAIWSLTTGDPRLHAPPPAAVGVSPLAAGMVVAATIAI